MEKKAEYQVFSSVNEAIHEIVITGKITEFDIPDLQKEIKSLCEIDAQRLLIDIRSLHPCVYRGMMYYIKCPETDKGRTAIVDIPKNDQFKSFWEELTRHAPMKLKWFSDIDDARDWLKSIVWKRTTIVDRLFYAAG